MFRLVSIRRGYPLALAKEFTASTFETRETALAALGPHTEADGYAGTFNPRHPAASAYYLVAVSTSDPALAVVTDTP